MAPSSRSARILGPRKTVEDALAVTERPGSRLKRDLSRLDIMIVGIGVMVGAGIFVLIGQAAATEAGPAVMLSFVLAAVVCGLCALSYAELAAMVPFAGSAYTFSYATLG
ncbi:MAG: amino acid permease [Solirubrobacteraceae bacterium]